jgi:hypothetical protein
VCIWTGVGEDEKKCSSLFPYGFGDDVILTDPKRKTEYFLNIRLCKPPDGYYSLSGLHIEYFDPTFTVWLDGKRIGDKPSVQLDVSSGDQGPDGMCPSICITGARVRPPAGLRYVVGFSESSDPFADGITVLVPLVGKAPANKTIRVDSVCQWRVELLEWVTEFGT